MKITKISVVAIVSCIIGIAIGVGGTIVIGSPRVSISEYPAQEQFPVPVGVNEVQNSFRYVAQKVLPSIVTIGVVASRGEDAPDGQRPWFDFFFGQPDEEDNGQIPDFRSDSFGSGVIVQRDGDAYYVVTNAHVVSEADQITITFSDGSDAAGQLVGIDRRKDLAMVSFNSDRDIEVAELGDSSGVQVGDWVLAIGSPFNFRSTVTAGIVSAVGRRGGPQGNINDFIQTDAAINRGNSGGALVDITGRVIGINTWITSRTGTNIGLGFAIPINNVKKPIEDFIAKGRVEYGWLGVSIRTLTPEEAEALELPDDKGAFIQNVYEDSPAGLGGILPGDFITAIEGGALSNSDEFLLIVGDFPVGKTARMQLYRQGVVQTVRVQITARQSERDISDQNNKLWPGMRVSELTDSARERLELARGTRGMLVEGVEPRTPSAIAGLRTGDVITRINDRRTDSLLEFYGALNSDPSGDVEFQFVRQERSLSITIVR